MTTSLTGFRAAFLDRLLELLWRQWTAVGVSGHSRKNETMVVDPEALLVLTATIGRYDARLFDSVLDWLRINGDYLNAQRIRNLGRRAAPQTQAVISCMAAILGERAEAAMKWKKLASTFPLSEPVPLFYQDPETPMPVAGELDPTYLARGLQRPLQRSRMTAAAFPQEGAPSLLLRLRALLGVHIRCEILCLLGARAEAHPSLLARLIGLSPRTVQNILVDMTRSGLVQVRTEGRQKQYALVPGPLDGLLRPDGPTPWRNSAPFYFALEKTWFGICDPRIQGLDNLTLASHWRRLAREVSPQLGLAGLGQPLRLAAKLSGENYVQEFMADVLGLLETP